MGIQGPAGLATPCGRASPGRGRKAIRVREVMTDNGSGYVSGVLRVGLRAARPPAPADPGLSTVHQPSR